MNLAFFISKRYLLAKKSHNAINIITAISVGLVALGTMALIVIMSVFNGLEALVGSLDSSLNADLVIHNTKAKYLDDSTFPINEIKTIKGVNHEVRIVEDNCLLKYTPALEEYNPREFIALIRGVDPGYQYVSDINAKMIDGRFVLYAKGRDFAVLGNGVAAKLQIHINDYDNPIRCYFPNVNSGSAINPLKAVNIENIFPAGVFSVQQEWDDKLMITSLQFAQKLMNLEGKYTSVDIGLDKNANLENVQRQIQQLLGEKYSVKNKKQQNVVMYNIMKSEKWSSFLILSFILFIATFNLVGALSVLIIDKQTDIFNLSFMGATRALIAKIFLLEGFLVTLSGTFLGIGLGTALVFIQDKFHLIPMQGAFVVDSFPVELRFSDLAAVLAIVVVVSMIAVIIPIKRLSKTILSS